MDKKLTGSYYTPIPLVDYMVKYAMSLKKINTVLEPCVGDGRFLDFLSHYDCIIDAVEIEKQKIDNISPTPRVTLIAKDFIDFSFETDSKYDLIIGNPPYISKKTLSDQQRNLSQQIVEYWSLPKDIFQNMWVTFILCALKLLSSDGSLFFVLPFEFLQVQYAEKLRNFLEFKFNTIEIVTFNEQVFTDIEQDICLVYLTNDSTAKPYIQYSTFNNIDQMIRQSTSKIMRNKPLSKWSNCIINDDETELLNNLSNGLIPIGNLGDISPGIVTGANNFFIIDQEQYSKYKIVCLPILQKSSSVSDKLIFNYYEFEALLNNNYRAWLLNLAGINEHDFNPELKDHLDLGEKEEIHIRYKCRKRKRWYDVPIIRSGDLCFFKRFDQLPRLIINSANVYTTDIAYNMRISDNYDKDSIAFCFYNSLTLAMCEYNGRFYGGGVGELVPSEFKSLRIPYQVISKQHIDKLDMMFRNKANSNEIIDFVDSVVLQFNQSEIDTLKQIRRKYLSRRLKK